MRAYYDSHPSQVTQLCLNFIIATDQATAQTIHDQIAAGTSFATADAGSGVDPNSPAGGEGPCVFPSDLVSQLGQATATAVEGLADGQLAPPQEIQVPNQTTGQNQAVWLVIAVRSRNLASFANTEAGLRQEMIGAGGPSLTADPGPGREGGPGGPRPPLRSVECRARCGPPDAAPGLVVAQRRRRRILVGLVHPGFGRPVRRLTATHACGTSPAHGRGSRS